MKKQLLILIAALLLTLCACSLEFNVKPSAQEDPVQEETIPERQTLDKADTPLTGIPIEKTTAEAFTAVEAVSPLLELKDRTVPATGLQLVQTQEYGPITASYYAADQNLDVWDIRQALFGATELEESICVEPPSNLGFEPFRTYANPSATKLLICKENVDMTSPTFSYYLYDGNEVCELTALNERPFGVVYPSRVRWRGDSALVYDVEEPDTGKYTTYLYRIETEDETILLADYDPFPFMAEDSVSERVLLIGDTYVLRVEQGGSVYLRKIPNGSEITVPNLEMPDTAYFHITQLNQCTALYFDADEKVHFTTLAFIDCESGNCTKLERAGLDDMDEQFVMLLNENTVAVPASTGTAEDERYYVFVYAFNGNAPLSADSDLQ